MTEIDLGEAADRILYDYHYERLLAIVGRAWEPRRFQHDEGTLSIVRRHIRSLYVTKRSHADEQGESLSETYILGIRGLTLAHAGSLLTRPPTSELSLLPGVHLQHGHLIMDDSNLRIQYGTQVAMYALNIIDSAKP